MGAIIHMYAYIADALWRRRRRRRQPRESRCASGTAGEGVDVWPVQDIVLCLGLCAQINTIIRAPTLCLGTPLHTVTARTIAQYNVPPRPPVIAIYTTQYWQLQYLVKAKVDVERFLSAPNISTYNEQALVCLSNREIDDASRGCTFHCKMANNSFFF